MNISSLGIRFKEEIIPWATFSSFHIRINFTSQQLFLFLEALSNFRTVLGRIEEIKCLGSRCGQSVPSVSILYFHDLFSAHGCGISSISVPNYLSLAATSLPLLQVSGSVLCLSCSFTFSCLSLGKFDHFIETATHPHRQRVVLGIWFLDRKTSGFTSWIKAAWLVMQWMNVQSKLCKIVWINLAPLAQTTPRRWKLLLLDGSVLEATWKYVGLLLVLKMSVWRPLPYNGSCQYH